MHLVRNVKEVVLKVQTVLFGWAGERLTMRLRLRVFANVLRQDGTFFDDVRHSTGRICTRLATDARNVKSVQNGNPNTL